MVFKWQGRGQTRNALTHTHIRIVLFSRNKLEFYVPSTKLYDRLLKQVIHTSKLVQPVMKHVDKILCILKVVRRAIQIYLQGHCLCFSVFTCKYVTKAMYRLSKDHNQLERNYMSFVDCSYSNIKTSKGKDVSFIRRLVPYILPFSTRVKE